MLKEFLNGLKGKSTRFKEMQTEDRLQHKLEERKKSSNERELDRFMEEEREKQIGISLNKFREMRKQEEAKQSILGGKNIFKADTTVLTNNDKLLKNQNIHQKGGHQFFK